jgi:cysteine desulfurase / selenocysteine lyase
MIGLTILNRSRSEYQRHSCSVESMTGGKTIEECRADFPSLERRRDGKPPIYLDNACTTLVPRQVIATMDEYYSEYPACGGRRSHHWFAEEVTQRIEGNPAKGIKGARRIVAEFIHAGSAKEIIFTLNATHAINIVALGFKFRPGDVVLLTDKEHNSNLMPWLKLQKAGVIKVDCLATSADGTFDLAAFEQKLKSNRVRLVSMAYTSNITGYTLPAREMIRIAHRCGARVLLDGAQTVPHQAVDVQELDVDFLAFSLHKMCGPRGVGVLYAKGELLGANPQEGEGRGDVIEPAILGGGTAGDTTYDSYSLLEAPERFEAGVQNYPGLIASGSAIEYLQRIGMDRISAHEKQLNHFLTGELLNRYRDAGWFRILGPRDAAQRGGVLTFEVRRPNAVGIAKELNERNNIMIRDGVFCVHSYFNDQFGRGWTRPKSHRDHRMIYRISFYIYNTIEECRVFLDTLAEVFQERSYL